ncbi:hypothetical protein L1887_31257 [Cichorium endivia]|nr:hypothetical protein L1887_31257 [Cichorium endivia]
METREKNSINHHNPPQSSQQSSPTSNHLHHGNHFHGFKEAESPGRNPNPDPDPSRVLLSQTPSQPPPPSTTATVVVRYRGCLKNHAANKGAHVLDGCGEFMPSGEDGTPEALKCAACECHRSFHRREVEGESQTQSGNYHTHHIASQIPLTYNQPPPASSSQQRHHRYQPPIMMAFGGAAAESSSEDLNVFRTNSGVQSMAQTSKKRFRTKFTHEQKEKMLDFAEKIGWKIQKQNEQEVVRFCSENSLKRQVFKVWMHNNKQATKKTEM